MPKMSSFAKFLWRKFWGLPKPIEMPAPWKCYGKNEPPMGVLCEFHVEFGGEPWRWTGYTEFDPDFDGSDIWWRLTAIGQMQVRGVIPRQPAWSRCRNDETEAEGVIRTNLSRAWGADLTRTGSGGIR